MLNEMLGIIRCPICGREIFRHSKFCQWYPFYNNNKNNLNIYDQINILNQRINNIEAILEQQSEIINNLEHE